MPTGSVISVLLTFALFAGTVSVTVAPLGTARCVVSSSAATRGSNGTVPQPVGVNESDWPLSVTVAGRHDVGSVMNVSLSVRPRLETGKGVLNEAIVESSPPSGRRLTDAWFLISPRTEMPSRAGSSAFGWRL